MISVRAKPGAELSNGPTRAGPSRAPSQAERGRAECQAELNDEKPEKEPCVTFLFFDLVSEIAMGTVRGAQGGDTRLTQGTPFLQTAI